jgi:hypothetical protein
VFGEAREAESGKRRDDYIKRIFGITAAAGRISKQRNNLLVADVAIRPTVGKDNWNRVRPITSLVHEVHIYPVDITVILREAV